MKKHVFLIALAGLMVLAACKKDKESQGVAQFTATMEHLGGRTSLDPNNGQILWTADDQIVIGNDNDETAVFTLHSGESTTEGNFGTSGEFNTVGPFIAAYPSSAEIEGDVVTFNLPATQTIGETGTFANGANPMIAYSDDKNLQFKNLCGGLGIRLKGVGAHVSAVRITSKNTEEKLWGAYEVSNCAADEPTLAVASGNQGTNVITLNCDVTLTTAAKTFFVMLPPGTLANGFTMEVLDGNEVLTSKETTSDVALVERNNVKCFNEILIDVEFDGNVEIPTGMSNADIIVTNYIEDAIPDENGDFAIGYSKMLMATNAINGEIIYLSTLSVDGDIRNGEKPAQNYELNAKETAITLALQMFPFGLSQSKDATFASIKDVLYSLSCVKNLETAIGTAVNQYGYLKMDELSSQLLAVRDFFMEELFPEGAKAKAKETVPVVGTIELGTDGSAKMDSPWLANSSSRGIKIEIKGSTYHPSTNTWTVDLTAHSENGIYVGINRGHFLEDNTAFISDLDKPQYFIPPMNAGKFIGTFVTWSGLKAYFSQLDQLLSGDMGFDETTWDMSTIENVHIELGTYYDALAMVSPWDDTRTAIVNAFYTVLGGVSCWISADGIQAFFADLFADDDFVLLFINNWNHGIEGFTIVANEFCERFEDFLFEQTVNLLARPEIIQKVLGSIVSMVNLGAFAVGTAASFNLFQGFAFHVSFPIPVVQTLDVENNTTTTAELRGNIVGETGYSVVERGFCYCLESQSIDPSIGDASSIVVPVGSGMGEFSYVAEDLIPNELYCVKAYAKTDIGEALYGNLETFFTHVFPTIQNVELVSVSGNSAVVRSVLEGETSFTVIERGFKYNTVPPQWPQLDIYVPSGAGMGTFSATLDGLSPGTNYRVEAYAKVTREGIAIPYTITSPEKLHFTTANGGGQVPTGAINGLFTINANGDQVYFSQGNLQYIGSAATPYWKFADHQWDYLGDNGQGNNSQNIDRDLFGWGESGYNHGAVCYQPWQNSATGSDYYAYGSSSYNLNDMTMQADWGYNSISNGGNQENSGWRTLTGGSNGEWNYIFNLRSTNSNVRYAKAKVNGVNGVIILPDNWNSSNYVLNSPNDGSIAYDRNIISSETWYSVFELNGSVFLPAAGYRDNRWGNSVHWVQHSGAYWTATHGGADNCYDMFFEPTLIDPPGTGGRMTGESVRLVRNAE